MIKLAIFLFLFLFSNNSLANKDIIPGLVFASSIACDIKTQKCEIPEGWKGLDCISKGKVEVDDVHYLINISKKKIIEPKIDEYVITFKKQELKLTFNEILFGKMDGGYAYTINRKTLEHESVFYGSWKCNLVSPHKLLEPLIEKIIKSKNTNKL